MLKVDFCSDLHVDRHKRGEQRHRHDLGYPRTANWPFSYFDSKGDYSHFDFKFFKSPDATVLVIAGDISDNFHEIKETVQDAARHYDHVVWIDGNHDVYHGAIEVKMKAFGAFGFPNVTYLDGLTNWRVNLGDTAIIGANCWYDWKCFEPQGITFPRAFGSWCDHTGGDSTHVDFGDYLFPSTLGAIQVLNLQGEMQQISRDDSIQNVIVATHSVPLAELLHFKPGNEEWNLSTPSYCNSMLSGVLECDTNNKIRTWIYGHTHERKTTTIGGVEFVNKSYGYPSEAAGVWSMGSTEV